MSQKATIQGSSITKQIVRLLTLFTLASVLPISILAQSSKPTVLSEPREIRDTQLDHMFKRHQRVSMSIQTLYATINDPEFQNEIQWQLGDIELVTTLFPHELRSDDYTMEIHSEDGVHIAERTPCTTYRGWSAGAGEVRLSITKERISGFLTDEQGSEIYIQPLSDFIGTDLNQSVLYRKEDVIADPEKICGSSHRHDLKEERKDQSTKTHQRALACVEAEVAIAADYSMYTAYGSNTATLESHLLGLKNMQEAAYAFYPIEFSVVKTTIITSSGGDPWTSSTNAGTLLDDFCCWAGNGSSSQLGCSGGNGFGVEHDLGELWTNRNFGGSTVGIAWIGSVCSSMFRYSANQNLGLNIEELRVLIAHEQGHNFGANHVSGQWIMNGYVDPDATTFSPGSQSVISSEIADFSCLGSCGGGGGPTCESVVTISPGGANGSFEASVMITTSGNPVVTSQATYDAPTVQINRIEVASGSSFEIMTQGCN